MSNFTELHALTGAYAVDAVDDLERLRFEKHLGECEDCAAEVASLREAAGLLSNAVEAGPSGALRDRVLADIRLVRPLPPHPAATEVVRRHARRFPRLVSASVAAAVLVVGGGVVASAPWKDATNSSVVALPERVMEAADAKTQSVEFPNGAKATLYHSRSVDRAVLVTNGMAEAPAGKVYEFWYLKSGTMVPAGLMTGGGNQTALLHGSLAGAAEVGITIEPASGSKVPTSAPIAQFDLSKSV